MVETSNNLPRLEVMVAGDSTDARFYKTSSTNSFKPQKGIFRPKEEEITLIRFLIEEFRFLINDGIFQENAKKEAYHLLEKMVIQLGTYLYAALFRGNVEQLLNEALKNPRLRIEIMFNGTSAKYAEWPWEYLYKPKSDVDEYVGDPFLIKMGQGIVVRKLSTNGDDQGDDQEKKTSKPKMLLIISDPVHYSVQCDLLIQKLRDLDKNQYIELEVIDKQSKADDDDDFFPQVRREKLKSLLQEKSFDIIHFVGHGRCNAEGADLALNDRQGEAEWVPGKDFAEWIKVHKPKLVFLQACETALPNLFDSKVQGVALECAQKDIPAVIAMQYKIRDDVATSFAEKFYEALIIEQLPIDLAAKAGRDAINTYSESFQSLAFGLPVLYLRSYDSFIVRVKEDGQREKEQRQSSDSNSRPQGIPTLLGVQALESKQIYCPRCKTLVTLKIDKFCRECGFDLSTLCQNCGKEPKSGDNFCSICGTLLPPPQDGLVRSDGASALGGNIPVPSIKEEIPRDNILSQPEPTASKAPLQQFGKIDIGSNP